MGEFTLVQLLFIALKLSYIYLKVCCLNSSLAFNCFLKTFSKIRQKLLHSSFEKWFAIFINKYVKNNKISLIREFVITLLRVLFSLFTSSLKHTSFRKVLRVSFHHSSGWMDEQDDSPLWGWNTLPDERRTLKN